VSNSETGEGAHRYGIISAHAPFSAGDRNSSRILLTRCFFENIKQTYKVSFIDRLVSIAAIIAIVTRLERERIIERADSIKSIRFQSRTFDYQIYLMRKHM